MGDERDRHKLASDEPDVEAHKHWRTDDAPADKKDDEPDVEAHKHWRADDAQADEKDDDDDTPDVEAHRHKL